MTIREKLVEKVQNLPEESLSKVYEFVENIEETDETEGLLKRLRKIKIQGPKDFSRNIDLYLSGEKKIEDNVD
ncbi:MAG: hypothetical protein M3405_05110 [Acidobacteriota bacterium]|jgi:hypothetical protein|nr:hypothetical protein [Acidobacteriota bacterium]